MARTQKNKATSYHLGTLKAKLAKLRRDLIGKQGGSGGASERNSDNIFYGPVIRIIFIILFSWF
jgi:ribosome-interacting GTPase 1